MSLRTAPAPKYLKMHYVKEEIGDGKGVFDWEMKADENMYIIILVELKDDFSPQPLQKPSPSNRPFMSLCSLLASPCLPHTGWPSAGTNTASCSLRSWG